MLLAVILWRQEETTEEQRAAWTHESDQGGSEERFETEKRCGTTADKWGRE